MIDGARIVGEVWKSLPPKFPSDAKYSHLYILPENKALNRYVYKKYIEVVKETHNIYHCAVQGILQRLKKVVETIT